MLRKGVYVSHSLDKANRTMEAGSLVLLCLHGTILRARGTVGIFRSSEMYNNDCTSAVATGSLISCKWGLRPLAENASDFTLVLEKSDLSLAARRSRASLNVHLSHPVLTPLFLKAEKHS